MAIQFPSQRARRSHILPGRFGMSPMRVPRDRVRRHVDAPRGPFSPGDVAPFQYSFAVHCYPSWAAVASFKAGSWFRMIISPRLLRRVQIPRCLNPVGVATNPSTHFSASVSPQHLPGRPESVTVLSPAYIGEMNKGERSTFC